MARDFLDAGAMLIAGLTVDDVNYYVWQASAIQFVGSQLPGTEASAGSVELAPEPADVATTDREVWTT